MSTHKDIVSVLPLEMFYSTVAFLSDSLFCPSEAVKKELNSFIKNSDIPIERIYNDIDIRPEPQFLSEGSTKTIVTISNISKNKGISVLLESADIVCREIPDAVFQVIGRVEDKEYYKNLLVKRNSMGLEKQFCFKGFQDDVYQFLYTSDVFVSASMSEGLGIVLLEAMNAGKPVVATESGGAAEMVVDGETGFLVPVNDSRIMAERIIALLEKPEDAMNMGRAGYERVKKNFYLQKQVDAFSELLEKQQSQLKTHQIKPSNSVSALVKNLDSIGDEYYRILSSRSWRYTAFLRHIKKMASSLRVKWLHKG